MSRKLLREPLLHFLLLGLGLFLLHGWIAPSGSGADEQVVITQGRIEQLAAGYLLMHQRQPSTEELELLIDEAVREEILYREARALGLDQDDTLIRRRLRQKLEFVSEDVAPVADPTDEQLASFLQAHPEQFRREARYAFTHVFLDPQRHGDALDADVGRVMSTLNQEGDRVAPETLGDDFLLARSFDGITAAELARLFGARFEVALRTLPTNAWQGPVPSGYGMHVVRISSREDGQPAALAEVRDEVRREWSQDQRRQANERYYADLLSRYEVTVERPDSGTAGAAPVVGLAQ